jgi:hypothetical protein
VSYKKDTNRDVKCDFVAAKLSVHIIKETRCLKKICTNIGHVQILKASDFLKIVKCILAQFGCIVTQIHIIKGG